MNGEWRDDTRDPASWGHRLRRTGSQFGLADEQWDAAKHHVQLATLDQAYERRMTWYGEVASAVDVIQPDPCSNLMSHSLGSVFEDEHRVERRLRPTEIPEGI